MKMKRILALVAFAAAFAFAGDPGEKGGQFLKMSADARSASVGGVVNTLNNGSGAVFGNPAALEGMASSQFRLTHMTRIQGLRFINASVAMPLGKSSLGFGAFVLYDKETRRDTLGNDIGDFGNYNDYFVISYACPVKNKLSAGMSLKTVICRLDTYKSSNIAFDGGLRYTGEIFEAGLTVRNIATGLTPSGDEETLPVTVSAGSSVKIPFGLLFAVSADFPTDSSPVLRTGLEYSPFRAVEIRAGWRKYTDNGNLGGLFGLNAGFGISYGVYNFDYAYSPSGDLEGGMHRFTLGMSF